MDIKSDRISCHRREANQLRLFLTHCRIAGAMYVLATVSESNHALASNQAN